MTPCASCGESLLAFPAKKVAGFVFGLALFWLVVFDATNLYLELSHVERACLRVTRDAEVCVERDR